MQVATPLIKSAAEKSVFQTRYSTYLEEEREKGLANGMTGELVEKMDPTYQAVATMRANRAFIDDRLTLLPISSVEDSTVHNILSDLRDIVKHINYTY